MELAWELCIYGSGAVAFVGNLLIACCHLNSKAQQNISEDVLPLLVQQPQHSHTALIAVRKLFRGYVFIFAMIWAVVLADVAFTKLNSLNLILHISRAVLEPLQGCLNAIAYVHMFVYQLQSMQPLMRSAHGSLQSYY
jgi:hypothetical protein